MFYLVSYDIQDDKARLEVMKYLKDLGYHVQKSVFILNCESRAVAVGHYQTIVAMVDLAGDHVLMSPVCDQCWGKALSAGNTLDVNDDVWIV
jgi:CRISPR-associated endonuclease Cas2